MVGHKLIFLLALLLPIPALALNIPGGPGTINVCGQILSTTNLIQISCRLSVSSNRCTAARAGDNASTPSSYSAGKGTAGGSNAANGKAFRVVAVAVKVTTAGGTNTGAEMWYSDNDLGDTSAGTFTNGVNIFGLTTGNGYILPTNAVDNGNNTMDQNIHCVGNVNWLIPNGKFPGFKGDATVSFRGTYWGYEE